MLPDKIRNLSTKEEYLEVLEKLTDTSNRQITMLTMLADENINNATEVIEAITTHASKTSCKLAVMYLVDSIVKKVNGDYVKHFAVIIASLFSEVFKAVDEPTRQKLNDLRLTWTDVFPASRLFQLDSAINLIDPAWKIYSANSNVHVNSSYSQQPAVKATTSSTSASKPSKDRKSRIRLSETNVSEVFVSSSTSADQKSRKGQADSTKVMNQPIVDSSATTSRDPRLSKSSKKIAPIVRDPRISPNDQHNVATSSKVSKNDAEVSTKHNGGERIMKSSDGSMSEFQNKFKSTRIPKIKKARPKEKPYDINRNPVTTTVPDKPKPSQSPVLKTSASPTPPKHPSIISPPKAIQHNKSNQSKISSIPIHSGVVASSKPSVSPAKKQYQIPKKKTFKQYKEERRLAAEKLLEKSKPIEANSSPLNTSKEPPFKKRKMDVVAKSDEVQTSDVQPTSVQPKTVSGPNLFGFKDIDLRAPPPMPPNPIFRNQQMVPPFINDKEPSPPDKSPDLVVPVVQRRPSIQGANASSWKKFREENPEFLSSDKHPVQEQRPVKKELWVRGDGRKHFIEPSHPKTIDYDHMVADLKTQLDAKQISNVEYEKSMQNIWQLSEGEQIRKVRQAQGNWRHQLNSHRQSGRGFHKQYRGQSGPLSWRHRNDFERNESFPEPVVPVLSDAELAAVPDTYTQEITFKGAKVDLRTYGEKSIVLPDNFDPHVLSFQHYSCDVVIDSGAFVFKLSTDEPSKHCFIYGVNCHFKVGSPCQEIFINGKPYPYIFGSDPFLVDIGGRSISVKLTGETPPIYMHPERDTSYLLGKIPLIINGKKVHPIYLDPHPQKITHGNVKFIVKFIDSLQAVLINGVRFPVKFGELPIGFRLQDQNIYLRFTKLRDDIVAGKVNIIGMDDGQSLFPIYPPSSVETATPIAQNNLVLQPPIPHVSMINPVISQAGIPVNQLPQSIAMPPLMPPGSIGMNPMLQTGTTMYPISQNSAPGNSSVQLNSIAVHQQVPQCTNVSQAPLPSSSIAESTVSESNIFNTSSNANCIPGLGTQSSQEPVDINSLLDSLIKTGILSSVDAPQNTQDSKAPSDNSDDEDSDYIGEATANPDKMWEADNLKRRYSGVIRQLHRGMQCATCGMRFAAENGTNYSKHLDWHFRMNQKQQDSIHKPTSRSWYLLVDQWYNYEELEDDANKEQSLFDKEPERDGLDIEEELNLPSVAASRDDGDHLKTCPQCHEKFEQIYDEEEEAYHYKNAIQVEGFNYHPDCYNDHLKIREREQEMEIRKKVAQELKEAEFQRERELVLQKEREAQAEKEAELQREKELQLKKEREAELQRLKEIQSQKEVELQQEKELEAIREKEAERERQKEVALLKQKEIQLHKERELRLRKESEAQEEENKMQREGDLQIQKEKDLQFQKEKDVQLQKDKELQLEKDMQLQKEKELEELRTTALLSHESVSNEISHMDIPNGNATISHDINKVKIEPEDKEVEMYVPPDFQVPSNLRVKEERNSPPPEIEVIPDTDITEVHNDTDDLEEIDRLPVITASLQSTLDGNVENPDPMIPLQRPAPVIKVNFGNSINISIPSKQPTNKLTNGLPNKPEEKMEDFVPPPFTFNCDTHPHFENVELTDQPVYRDTAEDSSLCSIM